MTVAAESVPALPALHEHPPGERYYRHPGDLVRLVVWVVAVGLLWAMIELAPDTSAGLSTDLGDAAAALARPLRQLLLGCAQIAAIVVPAVVVVALVLRRRWRRLGTLALAVALGALVAVLVGAQGATAPRLDGALTDGWPFSSTFPSPAYLAAAVAAATVGKPWLSRRWRHAVDVATLALAVTMAVAGTVGIPQVALAAAGGGAAGAAVLVALGAPNRRPSPAAIAAALAGVGRPVTHLELERAEGGRAQLYRAQAASGTSFLKVYGQDSRDADLLYRSYRNLVLRHAGDLGARTLAGAVEHEALVLLLAARAGVRCPELQDVVALPDGSMVLAMADVVGRRLDEVGRDALDDALLDAVWREAVTLHAAGLAHGSLRAANVLVDERGPVIIDAGAGRAAADARSQAIDRAELLASLAVLVGADVAVASAARTVPGADLAAALPYLQPLALSAATRRAVSKAVLRELRERVAEATGSDPVPLERLVRVRPRTLLMVATLTGAFYFLLPQLSNVDDSVDALGSANWGWLAAATVMSGATYVAAAVGMIGGVRERLPFVATVQVALASSFVNRVTPANVGGMALNVRFMQKAGIPPAEAVTGVGLNVFAGAVVHIGLLAVFVAWARQGGGGFAVPGSSKLLVVIAVVLALVGLALATRRGRRLARTHVLPPVRQSLTSMRSVAASPARLVALFGGSVGVTVAYVAALSFAINAFDGGLSFAQVGAVYLGASLIAAAAPTPGGLGALEAALVAGLTGVGMDSATAVAAVLSYRLLTFWLPVLPGWLSFQLLERRNYI